MRWIVASVVTLLFTAGILTYRELTNPARLHSIAVQFLQEYATGKMEVGSASFGPLDGLVLTGVKIHDEPLTPGGVARPLLECPRIDVKLDLARLLMGRLIVQSVSATAPRCIVLRNAPDGGTSFAGLALHGPASGLQDVSSHPMIELRDAVVEVVDRTVAGDRLVDRIEMTIRARARDLHPELVDIVWRGGEGAVTNGHVELDVRSGEIRNVSGGMPWISLEAVMIGLNSHFTEAGSLPKLLGLHGRVRVRDFKLSASGCAPGQCFALIDLERGALSIPIIAEEQPLSPGERYLRFDAVGGTLEATPEAVTVEFDGRFHGSECKVRAKFSGAMQRIASLDDVSVEASLAIKGFTLPSLREPASDGEARFVNRWRPLRRMLEEFSPGGVVDVTAQLGKPQGAEAAVEVRHAQLIARDASVMYELFPYTIAGCTGLLEFTADGLTLQNLCGRHGETEVCIDGWVSEPSPFGAGLMELRGSNVLMENDLHAALPPEFRDALDQFCPEGTFEVTVQMARGKGVDGKKPDWNFRTLIEPLGIDANYVEFPYPLQDVTGLVSVYDDVVSIEDVVGSSGPTVVTVSGVVPTSDDCPTATNVRIDGAAVPIDERLLAAIPEVLSGPVRNLNPSGQLDVTAGITRASRSQNLEVSCDAAVREGAAAPSGLGLTLTDVSGSVGLSGEQIELRGIEAKVADGVLQIDGVLDWAGTGSSAIDVAIDDVVLDDDLVEALPDSVREHVGEWRTDTPLSIQVSAERPADRDWSIRTTVLANGATVRHPSIPFPIEAVRAHLDWDGSEFAVDVGEARVGQGYVAGTAKLTHTEDALQGEASLRGDDLELSTLVWLLPSAGYAGGRTALPRGTMDLRIDHATFEKARASSGWTFDTAGSVRLHELVSVSDGTALARVGDIAFHAGSMADSAVFGEGVASFGSVNLGLATLEDVAAQWSIVWDRTESLGRITLTQAEATLCDGSVAGDVTVSFGHGTTEYQVTAVAHRVDVRPFASSRPGSAIGREKPLEVSGWAEGELMLTGIVGDEGSRRGRGRLSITEGRLYRLPLLAAILQVMNLNIPTNDTLDEAEAQFLVKGNQLLFDRIYLRGTTLGLVGSGAMSLPDQGVSLRLVNVNPKVWGRVPVLGTVAAGISRELMELHITGPLSQPQVRTAPLRAVTEELRDLFQPRKPRRVEAQR